MADTKNTEVPPASEPAAPVQEAPVVVREKRSWAMPLVSALVVVAALVTGGIGGFAIATQSAGRPANEQGRLPTGQVQPGEQGQRGPEGQQGAPGANGPHGQGGPNAPRDGDRPQPPSQQPGDDTPDDDGSDSTEE